MPVHKWRKESTSYFGEVWAPYAQIELRGADGSFHEISLQVHSGAVISMLRRSVSDLLGIDLESGQRIEVGVAGGTNVTAFLHKIHTRFADNIQYPVPYAIASTETVPNLLGRRAVFDHLQIDFDGTVQETRIAAPWLDESGRRIWQFLIDTEKHILARWSEKDLSNCVKQVATYLVNRAGQIRDSMQGMLKSGCCYAGPLFVRALFELSLQCEYLLQDPQQFGQRAEDYIDFTWITKYRWMQAVVKNPQTFVAQQIAGSPLRAQVEPQIEQEFARVSPNFRGCNQWYRMSVRDLAKALRREGEYDLVYKVCSYWAHGDPVSTSARTEGPFCRSHQIFAFCVRYYGRMLLAIANAGRIVLTDEQWNGLNAWARGADDPA